MISGLSCINLTENLNLVSTIVAWYFEEWQLDKVEMEKKLRLCSKNIPLQVVILQNGSPVATGGIYTEVNLLKVQPQYKKYSPWLALLYTLPQLRGQGIGSYLCDCLDLEAEKLKLKEYYLYTSTSENLYLRKNWKTLERVTYKNKNFVIMKKDLNTKL